MAEEQMSQTAWAMTLPAKKGYRSSNANSTISRDARGLRMKARGLLCLMSPCAIMSASMRALQDHAFDPRPPTNSCADQRLVRGPQPLDQGHELAIEGQPAVFMRGGCLSGPVMEPRRRAPLQRRQRSSQVGPGLPRLTLDAGREGLETLRHRRIASVGGLPRYYRYPPEDGIGAVLHQREQHEKGGLRLGEQLEHDLALRGAGLERGFRDQLLHGTEALIDVQAQGVGPAENYGRILILTGESCQVGHRPQRVGKAWAHSVHGAHRPELRVDPSKHEQSQGDADQAVLDDLQLRRRPVALQH